MSQNSVKRSELQSSQNKEHCNKNIWFFVSCMETWKWKYCQALRFEPSGYNYLTEWLDSSTV